MEHEQERRVFGWNTFIAYPIAAAILILVAVALWLQYYGSVNNPLPEGSEVVQGSVASGQPSDFLVSSLLVSDEDIHRFVDDYLLEEVIVRADLSEQQLEDLFINTLLVEDSLVDDYLDESLLEQIIL